jgi:hypothetical protein
MSAYRFRDLALVAAPAEMEAKAGLSRLCATLGWQLASDDLGDASARVLLRLHPSGSDVPAGSALRYFTDEFSILDDTAYSYVSDGVSVLRLDVDRAEADAYLDASFFQKPRPLQWQLWGFCLLALLRRFGYFCLHAAAVISPAGTGVLIIGPSGSGKSTLAVGLIRAGWRYLSDDAVLLVNRATVSAVPLRTEFSIDADAAFAYADLRLGPEVPDAGGGLRRRVHIEDRYPHSRVDESVPTLLLFPSIVDADASALSPLGGIAAIGRLLAASGPQLFDRACMPDHVTTLRAVVRQSAAYTLEAGRDLHRHPERLLQLVAGLESM